MLKKLGYITFIIIFLCYYVTALFHSDFWGNILSPIITMIIFYYVLQNFFLKEKEPSFRLSGLFTSLSILVWALCDIGWIIAEMVYHINPDDVLLITIGYSLTNLFLVIAVLIYGIHVFRRWNTVQILFDGTVISYCIIKLLWVIFLGESIKNLLILNSDWLSIAVIIEDIIIIICITICYLSIREGQLPTFLKFTSAGILLYSIIDLVYYYQYFYGKYEPNEIVDAIYMTSFGLISVGGLLRSKYKEDNKKKVMYNIGRGDKEILLLLAPLLLVIIKGFMMEHLIEFIFIILAYFMMSSYIQNNIIKEGLLQKEKEINAELEQKNKELEILSNEDFITGLHNRRYFISYLDKMITTVSGMEKLLFIYIDINRFKMLTTMFGNHVRDRILYQIAEKLKGMLKENDQSILAAYGEDTFAFTIKGQFDYDQGNTLAQEAIRLCSDIYQIDDYQIKITVNAGISIYPYDAKTKEELIGHADIAKSQAMLLGCNKVQAYDTYLSEVIYRKNNIEIMLKKVIFNQEFILYFQPQVNTADKRLLGFEALLRWKTPNGEFIPPSEFIPIAEETGYIIPIGDWIIKNTFRQLAEWNKRSKEKFIIGINVSIKQLNSTHFIETLKKEMEVLSILPEWIDIEITETIQLEESQNMIKCIEDIRKLGFSISIDDFGTGYSSLNYLRSLPVNRIKIAKELIQNIHTDGFNYQLVKSIIMLSKFNGIKVIAEGVETDEQWICLKELKCDQLQGYLFGKPITAEEVELKYAGNVSGTPFSLS